MKRPSWIILGEPYTPSKVPSEEGGGKTQTHGREAHVRAEGEMGTLWLHAQSSLQGLEGARSRLSTEVFTGSTVPADFRLLASRTVREEIGFVVSHLGACANLYRDTYTGLSCPSPSPPHSPASLAHLCNWHHQSAPTTPRPDNWGNELTGIMCYGHHTHPSQFSCLHTLCCTLPSPILQERHLGLMERSVT